MSLNSEATPIIGRLKSSSRKPTARSMARLGARPMPPVVNRLRRVSSCDMLFPLCKGYSAEAFQEGFLDLEGNEFLKLTMKRGDLPDQGAADVRIGFAGHQKHGLNLGVEDQVGERHGEFIFHVAGSAQSAEHDPPADLAHE